MIDLMHKYNVTRALFLSTASHKDANDKRDWNFAALVQSVKTFAYNAYADVVATGEVVMSKGADLDYTLVRVPILTNSDSEAVITGYIGDGKIGTMLARKAFASFAVGEEWLKKAPMICNA